MGRTPDHVASFLAGLRPRHLSLRQGAPQADNVVRFYEFARDNHLYVSYTLVPPQIDRSRPAISRQIQHFMPGSSRNGTAAS